VRGVLESVLERGCQPSWWAKAACGGPPGYDGRPFAGTPHRG
jgi:hypothetical protein